MGTEPSASFDTLRLGKWELPLFLLRGKITTATGKKFCVLETLTQRKGHYRVEDSLHCGEAVVDLIFCNIDGYILEGFAFDTDDDNFLNKVISFTENERADFVRNWIATQPDTSGEIVATSGNTFFVYYKKTGIVYQFVFAQVIKQVAPYKYLRVELE